MFGLLALLLGLVLSARAAEFLEPDKAFLLSARSPDGAQIEVRFDIVDAYYMYRERLAIKRNMQAAAAWRKAPVWREMARRRRPLVVAAPRCAGGPAQPSRKDGTT